MKVSDAVAQRRSIRAFLDKPVETELVLELLEKSARAPSGGNLQPWRIYLINGDKMSEFMAHLESSQAADAPPYEIYPKGLKEPYRSSRYKVGEDMYALLGVDRDDKQGRFNFLLENFRFFGAPVGLFCFVDKQMGKPQWSDLGMFLQSFMLLAKEAGLDTCAQEAWAMRAQSIQEFVKAPEEETFFCGMALGYADESAKVNELRTDREPLDTFVKVL